MYFLLSGGDGRLTLADEPARFNVLRTEILRPLSLRLYALASSDSIPEQGPDHHPTDERGYR